MAANHVGLWGMSFAILLPSFFFLHIPILEVRPDLLDVLLLELAYHKIDPGGRQKKKKKKSHMTKSFHSPKLLFLYSRY